MTGNEDIIKKDLQKKGLHFNQPTFQPTNQLFKPLKKVYRKYHS